MLWTNMGLRAMDSSGTAEIHTKTGSQSKPQLHQKVLLALVYYYTRLFLLLLGEH